MYLNLDSLDGLKIIVGFSILDTQRVLLFLTVKEN